MYRIREYGYSSARPALSRTDIKQKDSKLHNPIAEFESFFSYTFYIRWKRSKRISFLIKCLKSLCILISNFSIDDRIPYDILCIQ